MVFDDPVLLHEITETAQIVPLQCAAAAYGYGKGFINTNVYDMMVSSVNTRFLQQYAAPSIGRKF